MTREEIIKTVAAADNTVLSFPNRGPWGSSSYRGNCSGYIPAYFAWKFNAKSVSEVFAGSGTTSDVCRDLGIPYIGIDLNPKPVRSNIVSMDILNDEIELPDGFYESDMCFLHPPYPGINNIHYSTGMWKGNQAQIARDIQEMPWEQGMNAVNHAIMRAYNALKPGAYEVVLVGEIRSKGQYRSMMADLIRPTQLHQTFIKLQHNCVSDRSGNTYSNSDRALTGHEMIAVFKKPDAGYQVAFILPKTYEMDIRDSVQATWKDILSAVMRKLGKESTLEEIYAEVEGNKKAKSNPNWKAKVRQTLQLGGFRSSGRGIWAMSA